MGKDPLHRICFLARFLNKYYLYWSVNAFNINTVSLYAKNIYFHNSLGCAR